MAIGTLVGAQVQDTTTTTGTGAITLANAVPATAPAGSTTFAAQFAPTAVFPVGNIFYAIIDTSGNIELGLGTLTSATVLTRDYILGSYTGGNVSLLTQVQSGSHVNFAAGTKSVLSNTTIFATSVAVWQRIPDDNAANIFNAVMSGTFAASLTDGVGTTAITIRFKVSNEGVVTFQIPAATVNNTGVALSITGIPASLTNVLATAAPCFVVGTAAGGVTVPGIATLTPGATPTSTGSIVFQQYTAAAFPALYTSVFTASVVRGTTAETVAFPLY